MAAEAAPPAAEPTLILVGLDLETAGIRLREHPIVSLGIYALCPSDPKLLEFKKRLNFQVNWFEPGTDRFGDFEPRCVTEFWDKLPRTHLAALQENAHPPCVAMGWFAVWLDELEARFPPPNYEIRFVSDNPSMDIARLDAYLENYASRDPVRVGKRNGWRRVINPTDMLRTVPKEWRNGFRGHPGVTHDHLPENDAHVIVLDYLRATEYAKDTTARLRFANLLEREQDRVFTE